MVLVSFGSGSSLVIVVVLDGSFTMALLSTGSLGFGFLGGTILIVCKACAETVDS